MRIIDRLSQRRDRIFAIVDQGFTGIGNFTALTLLARSLPTAQYAAIGAAIALHFVLFGFYRATIVLPYILAAKDDDRAVPEGAWCWLAFRVFIIQAGVMLLASMAATTAGCSDFTHEVALCAAIQSPPLLLQEFSKRWLYQHRRAGAVALSSAIGFAIVITAILAMMSGGASWIAASLALGSGAQAAAVVGFAFNPPGMAGRFVRSVKLLGRRRRFAAWQSLTHIPYVLYNTGYPLLLAAISGPGVTASYTALRTLLSPAGSLISAVDATDKVRAVAAYRIYGLRGAKQSVDRTRVLLLALNGPALIMAALAAGPIQHLMFGDSYHHPVEMAVLASYFLLLSINQPYESFMVVQEAARSLLVSRCLSAGLAILLLIVLAPRLGLMGAVIALVVAQVANFIALHLLSLRKVREVGRPLTAIPS